MKTYFIFVLLFCTYSLQAADSLNTFQSEKTLSPAFQKPKSKSNSLGFGIGLDYGGIGLNITHNPINEFGFFAGLGYAFAGIGYNVGCKFRFYYEEKEKLTPFLNAMYGYNTAVSSTSTSRSYNSSETLSFTYDKLYYGVSVGIGLDYFVSSGNSYWSGAIIIPLRNSEAQTIAKNSDLMPIAFSFGYHFY